MLSERATPGTWQAKTRWKGRVRVEDADDSQDGTQDVSRSQDVSSPRRRDVSGACTLNPPGNTREEVDKMTTTKETTMAITMRRQPGPVMKRMGQQQALIGERAILDSELITGTLTMDKDCVATIVTEERFKAQLEGWGYEEVR